MSTTEAIGEELDGVAIIGMACRFPGAPDVAAFRRNVEQGIESISTLSDAELIAAGVDPKELEHPAYVKRRGVIEDTDRFDARFFGLAARDVELMDPQHRLLLELAVEALEDAGHGARGRDALRTGVFCGVGFDT